MISIRKYLDISPSPAEVEPPRTPRAISKGDALSICLEAYRDALTAIGHASVDACPALRTSLDPALSMVTESLSATMAPTSMANLGAKALNDIEDWGRSTARHYQQKAEEVKELLLVVARTAESVGERDQRCARQLDEVTSGLRSIANLDDISQIRSSIEKSACALKVSIDRMTAEGVQVIDKMRAQVDGFKARLDEAEQVASSDTLTGLRSRLWMEMQIERRIAAGSPFCIALLDLDHFKSVNDAHGHLAGDEVLKQFATELKSVCRSTDLVGRWGGDEFIVVLDSQLEQAKPQMERVRNWVCGRYNLARNGGDLKLLVQSSIGTAEFVLGEDQKQFLDRVDTAMYADKTAGRKDERRRRV